jgi:hypothetical protein
VQHTELPDSEENLSEDSNPTPKAEILVNREIVADKKPISQRLKPVLFALMGISAVFLVWKQFFKPKNDGSFAYNFTMPNSIVKDEATRTVEIAEGDSNLVAPNYCSELLQLADESYQNKEFEDAQEALMLLATDTTGICASDGFYYMGVLLLKTEDPMLAIQCFSKVENYTKFGKDIQWYQALAMLQIAEKDEYYKERATAAMNNVLNATGDTERKERIASILGKLGD